MVHMAICMFSSKQQEQPEATQEARVYMFLYIYICIDM